MHFSQSAQLRDSCLCLGEESAGFLEFIVFLRPVKSRILWVQMLGRGTRKCPGINKTKFVVFDCFDGTLIQYFKNTTDFEIQPPTKTPLTLPQVIENIWQNVDRDYHVRILAIRIETVQNFKFDLNRVNHLEGIDDYDLEIFCYQNGDIAFSHIN